MASKKVFVTGAPGWLGNRLVEALVKQKRKVRCLVLRDVDVSFLKKLGAEIVVGDVTDKSSLVGVTKGCGVVFHCVGVIHPKKPEQFYKINRDGTRNMLEESVTSGVKKFIYVSSNSAQGVNFRRDKLMTEEDPCRPYTDYGKSKYQAEQIVKEYQNSGKIKTVIVRPCWFYGPKQPERMTTLMNMIKNGRPIIFGDGKNLRSMTYVDNLVNALLLVEKSEKAVGQIYWIADERPYKTIEIYKEIAGLLGVELRPRFIPKEVSQILEKIDILLGKLGIYEINIHVGGEMPRDIACSIDKARRELGYKPKIELEEGMKRSIEWARKEGLLDD